MPTFYVTVPRAAADDLAETLIDRRVAACVNRVDCDSMYRWEGEVGTDAEAILFCKTSSATADAFVETVKSVHPHDVPCIERFDEADVFAPYASWRDEQVSGGFAGEDDAT